MAETAEKFGTSTILALVAIKTIINCSKMGLYDSLCLCVHLSMSFYLSILICLLLTLTPTGHKVLVQSSKARVYCVVALCQAVELAHQTLVDDVPQMNALQTQLQQLSIQT